MDIILSTCPSFHPTTNLSACVRYVSGIYDTSTDFSLYKSDSIKQANFPRIYLSTPKQD
jgi:hypothetical protein